MFIIAYSDKYEAGLKFEKRRSSSYVLVEAPSIDEVY
jgi:hypothetical protein